MTEKPDRDVSHYFDAPELEPLPRVTMLMMEAGELASFDGRMGWPDAFTPKELAALQYPDDKAAQGRLIAMLTPVIYRGEIEAVTVMRASPVGVFALEAGAPVAPARKFSEPAVQRQAARDFLRGVDVDPSKHVRAWFGDTWQEPAPVARKDAIPATDDTLKKWEIDGSWEQKARAIGEAWMLAEEKRTGDLPGVEAIAKHVEGEFSNLDITGKRGRFLDWESIKREALTGITGRKAKGRK